MKKYFPQGSTRSNHHENTFTQLYETYFPLVFRTAYRFLNNQEDAEDVTAELFSNLWRARDQQGAVDNMGAYLFTMTRNLSLNHIKSQSRRSARTLEVQLNQPVSFTETYDTAQQQLIVDFMEELERYLPTLPPQERRVFELASQQYSNDEIGSILGLQGQTVRNLKAKALRRLRTALRQSTAAPVWVLFYLSWLMSGTLITSRPACPPKKATATGTKYTAALSIESIPWIRRYH